MKSGESVKDELDSNTYPFKNLSSSLSCVFSFLIQDKTKKEKKKADLKRGY